MKLVNGIVGTPIQPNYEKLRVALVAAQSTTPTARAASAADTGASGSAADRAAALHDLLTVAAAAADDALALGNSFAPGPPGKAEIR